MSESSSPDYKVLFLKAEEERKQAEQQQRQEAELRREAEEHQKQAEERERQEREHNQPTTFGEFIKYCHDLLWRPLRAEAPSRSTTGKIPPPTGKYCPIRLRPWTDCAAKQRETYASVCRYLQPTEEGAPQLFAPLVKLEGLGRRFALRPISSEQDLESYKRFVVKDHVRDIISELCKIPAAREEFGLGDGIWFDNHANALDDIKRAGSDTRLSRPDQFCIHHVDAPHKLSVETIRAGFRRMDFWHELWVPFNNPTTLYYDVGPRTRAWRNAAQAKLPIWHISFNSVRSQIPATTSKYLPLLSPVGSHVTKGCRVATRSHPQEDSLDSKADPALSAGWKWGFSQITLSPPTQRSAPGIDPQQNQGGQSCLQQSSALDPCYPNIEVYSSSSHNNRHLINIEDLVKMVKAQLDKDLDHNYTPIGSCGSYGAPFKITKGTTSRLWKKQAQGLVVLIYFLYSMGEIRHMLLMGWGGKSVGNIYCKETCQRAISRSVKEIYSLGNAKLKRALIINFHQYTLDH
ncbi:hypothetical protein BDV06DRAFT_213142 [Aspergillus oleicola]